MTNFSVHQHHQEELSKDDLSLKFLYYYFLLFFNVLNKTLFIEVKPINNVVIVSGGQQRDSAIHIHVSILPRLFSHPGCHITLSRVPCAISRSLLVIILNTAGVHVHPILPNYPFPHPLPACSNHKLIL